MKKPKILTLCGIVLLLCMGLVARGQTPITINGPDTICAGTADDYSFTITNGTSYFWHTTFQGSITSTTITGGNSISNIYWNGPASGTITVYGINNTGDTTEIGTKNVYVTGPPNIYITGDAQVICQPLIDTFRGDNPPPDTSCIRYCAYSTVTYTANGDPGGTFGWQIVGAVSFTPSGNTCVVNWGAPGFGSVTVVDTSQYGCITQTTICVELIPPPRARFTTLPGPINDTLHICDSTEVTFIDLSVGSPSPIVTWYWQFGDGATSGAQGSMLAPVTHQYNTPGTYIATLTVTNACGCSATDSMVIVVNDSPGVKITCPSVVCEFDTATYSVAVNCTVYDWSVTGGTIVSTMPYGNSIQVVWDNVDQFGFGYVTFTPGTNCSPLACAEPTVVKVPVIKQQGTIQGTIQVCINSQYLYKLPQWPGTVFNWHIISAPAGTTLYPSDQPNEIILATGPVPGTIELGVNYQNELLGCGGLAKIIIKVLPIAGITGPDVVCLNSTPSYNLVPGAYMGNWVLTYPDNSQVFDFGSIFNAGSSVVFDQVGTYILNVSGAGFCPPQAFYINVYPPPPIPDSVAGPLEICRGVPTEYTAYNAIPGTIFVWSAVNGTVNANAGNTTYATFLNNSGPFQIIVRRQSMSFPFCSSDPLIINLDTPQIDLNIQGPDTVCPSSQHPYFTAFTDGETYVWETIPSQYASVQPVNGSPNVQVLFNEVPPMGQQVLLILTVTKCGGIYKDTQKVLVRGTPNINMIFNPDVDTICALTPLQVSVASAFGFLCTDPATTIDWDFGDGVTIPNGGLVQSHSFPTFPGLSPVMFTITVTVNNPYCCGGSYTVSRDIWIKPAPIAYITPLGPFSFCDTTSYSVFFTADAQSGYGTITNFEWFHAGVTTGYGCGICSTFTASPTYGLGAYYVQVTNSFGCKNNSNIEFVEYNCIQDTCTPISPDIQVDSTGDCGTVTYTANITGTYYSIAWSAPGSLTTSTVGNSFTANYPQAGSYVVTMEVKVPSTTPGDTCTIAQYFNVLIPYMVGLNYSVVCDPANPGNYLVTLFDHSNYYPLPETMISNYSFEIGAGSQSGLGTSFSYSVPPGSVPISLTIDNPYFPPCSIFDTLELPALPVAGFNIDQDSFCVNDMTVAFENTSSGANSYWWDFDENFSYNTQEDVIKVYEDLGGKDVMLVATNQYGCSDTFNMSIQIVDDELGGNLIVVNNNPCEGQPVTLIYQPFGGTQLPETYTWIQDPDQYAITTIPTVDVYEPGQYWVIGTNHYGCEFTTSPKTVNVVQVPPAVIYGGTEHCVNEQFYLSGYAGPGPVSYRWFKNGVFYSSAQDLNEQYSSPTTYTLTLVVTVTGPGGPCSDTSAPFVVTIHPLPPDPTITFSMLDCASYEVELDASNTVPGTYNWNNGMTGDPISVYSGGVYTAFFTDTNGCKSKASIEVPKDPDAYLWIFPKGCYEFCYLTMPRYLPGPIIPFDYWAWLQNDGISLDGTNSVPSTYTLTGAGTYNLVLDNGLCADTSGNMYVEIDSNCTECPSAPVRLRRVWQTGDPIGYPCTDSFEVDFGNIGPGNMGYTLTAMNGMVMPYSGSVGVGVTTVKFRYIADPGFTGPNDIVIFTVTMPDGTICIVQIKIEVDPPCGNEAAPKPAGENAQTEQSGDDRKPALGVEGARMLLVPNPAGNTTRVDFHFAEDKERYIEVYDLSGRQMARRKVLTASGSADLTLDVYASGLYMVVIRENGKVMLQSKLTVIR